MTNRTIEELPSNLPRLVTITGGAALLEEPRHGATLETQVLFGEHVAVYGRVGEWLDACVEFGSFCHRGFVHSSQVGECSREPTHRVWETWTPVRSMPRLKAVVVDRLSLGSVVRVIGEAEDHYQIWPYGWIFKKHVREVGVTEPDFVSTITRFAGTPFMWGGRSSFGMDCSGMVQLGLQLAGVTAPRAMTDMAAYLGDPVEEGTPKAGDFLFYSEHCGMFVDSSHVINSNGKAGRVQIESFHELDHRMRNVRGYSYLGQRRLTLKSLPTSSMVRRPAAGDVGQ